MISKQHIHRALTLGISACRGGGDAPAPSAPTPTPNPVFANCTSGNFTRYKYDAIAVGMRIDEVSQIIGCGPVKDANNLDIYLNHQPEDDVVYWQIGFSSSPMIAVYLNPTNHLVTTFAGGRSKLAIGF